jgi:hypothetical protein
LIYRHGLRVSEACDPRQHHQHGALHGNEPGAVQGRLALTRESVCADCDLCRDGRNGRRSY